MTTRNLGQREAGTTDAQLYMNNARTVQARINARRDLGQPPTKDQSRDLSRWLALALKAGHPILVAQDEAMRPKKKKKELVTAGI